ERICNLAYASDGSLVTTTADLELTIDVDIGEATLVAHSGELYADEASSGATGGAVSFTVRQEGFDRTECRVSTKRDGVVLEVGEWTALADLAGELVHAYDYTQVA